MITTIILYLTPDGSALQPSASVLHKGGEYCVLGPPQMGKA